MAAPTRLKPAVLSVRDLITFSKKDLMTRAAVRAAVHRRIRRLLENQDDFDDNTNLMQLGLDKEDIEELIFRLEDQLGLTAFTAEEDRILKTARTANDLTRFLIEIGRY
ncbi:acyl carrier protein [Pseudomonas sp. ATCC 43928]|uniref:Phosphopantetheine-containing protein n=2 Tax=Pseudomonas TaxID=286 RepID=A0AB33E731_9PSED|nr:phosphopantetheine-containing protein [Pseudomonas frederiksbergensis]PMY56984.1 phosphopantetheine-containing protein [Pseudomonas sp. FW305-53]PMY83839.1 phosphopantetheine-containing protein [Pseudomonas sp. FW303-C2]PMY89738.1 phosphopantetheine-containing protein [Pseudomonas sp. FW305-62]PNA38739.1 phosphopantetheine-containing protein [Pseudomonas sp. FW306-2-2C-A10BC]PNA89942.1 phosphopantetheine-containing protein [Pseudomonas sp. MPR-R3B]PNB11575.1 phosphopantetheine-containing p